MEAEKCIKFNPKSGMALPAVICILLIVSLLGTAKYAYSYDSLKAIRYASDAKKADYLARSGVEAAAFAYQMVEDNDLKDTENVPAFLTAASADGAEVVTNNVYLVWDRTDGYKYVTEDQVTPYTGKDRIGYFTVTLKNIRKIDKIVLKNYNENGEASTSQNSQGKVEETNVYSNTKLIIAKGVSGTASKQMKGWMPDATVSSSLYYGPDGIIDGAYNDKVAASYVKKTQGTEKFVKVGQYTHTSDIYMKFSWLPIDPIRIGGGSRTIPFSVAYSAGNMILERPKDAGVISFAQSQDNLVSIVSLENVFVRSSVYAESSPGYFNNFTLKGKTIVIDGDIEMSAYGIGLTKNNASTWSSNYQYYNDLVDGKYRYGVVSICSLLGISANHDFNGIENSPYNYPSSGKIFFGGNVYVNITMPNVGTYRYRAFNAGDAYFFDSNCTLARENNPTLIDPTGDDENDTTSIDLFRYFLEKSIATKKYSKNVLSRFANVIEFYYGNADSSESNKTNKGITVSNDGEYALGLYVKYKIDDPADILSSTGDITYDAMRKISNEEFGDSLAELVPPDASNGSSLYWGEPKY